VKPQWGPTFHAFIFGLTLFTLSGLAMPAQAHLCDVVSRLFGTTDFEGFENKQDLFKNNLAKLSADQYRAYTPEEIEYLREREGWRDFADGKIGTLYRTRILFVRSAMERDLQKYYADLIPEELDTGKASLSAIEDYKKIYPGNARVIHNPGHRKNVINGFLSNENVHFKAYPKDFKITDEMAKDIYLLRELATKFSSLETEQKLLLKYKGENYLEDLEKNKVAIQKNLEIQNEIAVKNQWFLDYLKTSPEEMNNLNRAAALRVTDVTHWPPSCCLTNCKTRCPYNFQVTTQTKIYSATPPDTLQLYPIENSLKTFISPAKMKGPRHNSLAIKLYQRKYKSK
jgi:hypothetical protein